MAWRLHTLAERDYPQYGLFEASEEIFDYIYSHPDELVEPDTRLTHAEVLAAAGKLPEARQMLAMAEESIELDGLAPSGDVLRRVGAVYAILGEETRAAELLPASISAEQRALEVTTGEDERAHLLFFPGAHACCPGISCRDRDERNHRASDGSIGISSCRDRALAVGTERSPLRPVSRSAVAGVAAPPPESQERATRAVLAR